jgi:hypothetical protein
VMAKSQSTRTAKLNFQSNSAQLGGAASPNQKNSLTIP